MSVTQLCSKQYTTTPEQKEAIEDETALMEMCRQWDGCSTMPCPLDPLMLDRGGPPEGKCRARKSTRLQIVQEAGDKGIAVELPYGGLTRQEHGNRQRSIEAKAQWEARSAEEKQKRIDNLQSYGQSRSMSPGV